MSVTSCARVRSCVAVMHSHPPVCSSASSSDVSGDPSLTKRLDAALLGCVLAMMSGRDISVAAGVCQSLAIGV